jgi:murein DD-endopeptidase MepM/ murein hydrolase activator NlpD
MTTGTGKSGLFLIAAPLAALVGLAAILILLATGGAAAACTTPATRTDPGAIPSEPVSGYTGVQLTNAAYIMNAALDLNLEQNAQIIAVMVAMGESALTVLDHGDTAGPDSRGLFQQRDNGAWGTYDDRMNPTISATNFYTALTAVPGWEELEPTIAAHKVQHNADPYHYERYYSPAVDVVTALSTNATPGRCTNGPIAFPLSPGYAMTDDYGPRTAPTAGASSWHPAVDLQHSAAPCGDPITAITSGTVTYIGGYQITIKSPDGYDITYMHMKIPDVSVHEGDTVTPGQAIALVGSEGPSTGCHLDLRINTTGSTDPAVSALPDGTDQGGPASTAGFINPEEYYTLFGLTLCPAETCRRVTS